MQLSVSAGEFDNLVYRYEKIFLYLYTPECSYCVKFNPIYEKLSNKYPEKCKYIKVNANTPKGNELMQSVNGYYVPYVVLINSKTKTIKRVEPPCMLNYKCISDAVEKL